MAVAINIEEAKRDIELTETLREIFKGYIVVIHGAATPIEMVYYANPEYAVCQPIVSVIGSNGCIYITVKHQLHPGQITFVTDRCFEVIQSVRATDVDLLRWSPYFDPEMDMVSLPTDPIPETDEYDNTRASEILSQFVKIYAPDIRIADEDKPAIIKAATAPYSGSVTYI